MESEHRILMEEKIGRRLAPGETVHHMNGFRDDNRVENLELWFNQPYGQRIPDLIDYLVKFHKETMQASIEAGHYERRTA